MDPRDTRGIEGGSADALPARGRGVHPYTELWESGNLRPWLHMLDPDVSIHSPMLTRPFVGIGQAEALFTVIVDVVEDMDITRHINDNDCDAFFWSASCSGRPIEGTDLLYTNAAGRISEIRVMIRPLVAIADFAAAVGPRLARRGGYGRALLATLLGRPLRHGLVATDWVGSILVQQRA